MKKSVLSGLIAGALTVGMGYPAHAAEAADDSTQTYETEAIVVTASAAIPRSAMCQRMSR